MIDQPPAPLLRPRDLPRLRDSLVDWYSGPVGRDIVSLHAEEGLLPWDLADADRLGDALTSADLYHIATPMCELVEVAARTLPDFALAADDPTSHLGMAWFERPILDTWQGNQPSDGVLEVAVQAITWQVVADRLFVAIWVDRDRVTLPIRWQWRGLFPIVFPIGHYLAPIGLTGLTPGDPSHAPLASAKTMWLLSRQSVAQIEVLPPDRAARRQAERQNRPVPDVRVVNLRRPAGMDRGCNVEWHHSWIVRGHWRNQAHGVGRQERRPIWIAPYVKGPEDAPLLGGEKVYSWTR